MITNERRKAAGRRRPEQKLLKKVEKKGIKGDTGDKRENEEGREIHDVSSHKVANI